MSVAKGLILVSGPPGIGKSTLCLELAKNLPAVLLDKDAVDEPFSPGDRGPHYKENIQPKVVQGMLNLAELNLKCGLSVILDAPWTHMLYHASPLKTQIQDLATRVGARLLVIELAVSEETLKKRISSRGLSRDTCKLTPRGWEEFKRYNRVGTAIDLPCMKVDVEGALGGYFPRILDYIRREIFTLSPEI